MRYNSQKGKINLLKISKKSLYNYNSFESLKKRFYIKFVYRLSYKITFFLKMGSFVFYNGRFFLPLNIKSFFVNNKFKQYIFSKKPFSGPVKKFKK